MKKRDIPRHILILFLFCTGAAVISSAQKFTTLATFNGKDGANPNSPLVQGFNGDLYGTTPDSSQFFGTVFEMAPKHPLTAIYQFDFGDAPESGLVLGTDGNFYGTTGYGGANSKGTAFKITPAGELTTIYNFCSQSGCSDGSLPYAPLIEAVGGNFYGVTTAGGAHIEGTVFELTKTGRLTSLYSFCMQSACADGRNPVGGLVQATNGDFYGTTEMGGNPECTDLSAGCGTIFKITSNGTLTTLYKFCALTNCVDGWFPIAGLVQGTDGNLYGTTYSGGTGCVSGCGTVFKITPEGVFATLHSFCSEANCADGGLPLAGLLQASDGTFYGTTSEGGANGEGTIFTINTEGTLTTLYNFVCEECKYFLYPGALVQATNGTFYGTTEGGSPGCFYGCGTIFSLSNGLSPFVAFVRGAAMVGESFLILGQEFTGTTSVSLNGAPASYTVESDKLIEAVVPAGATTGYVSVITPVGTLTSNVPFYVIP